MMQKSNKEERGETSLTQLKALIAEEISRQLAGLQALINTKAPKKK